MLYGRTTYELMEDYWPAVARDEKAPRAEREWARTLEAMPKYVVSASRRDFPWNNTFRVEGELHDAVRQQVPSLPESRPTRSRVRDRDWASHSRPRRPAASNL